RYKVFPNPDEDFVSALAGCRGVITNSGHQLLSEALHLGKPVLSIPMEGQFEQKLNAEMLNKAGRGVIGSVETIQRDLASYLDFVDGFDPSRTAGAANIKFCLQDDTVSALSLLNYHIFKYRAVS
ncbi:MAG: glycosyltransferase family protein, partial [Spirochaetota bacterium]|nr:glycosyltransferase family protein [Spirochaetota bacterium]